MYEHRRRKLFIERGVQGMLLLRVTMYWLMALVSMVLMLTCWVVMREQPRTSAELWQYWTTYCVPAFFASLLVLPVVLIDCLRLSNRFAGPAYRVQRVLQRLADGEEVHPVHLRQGDYWYQMALEFNRVLLRVRAIEAELAGRQPYEEAIENASREAAGNRREAMLVE